MNANTRVTPRSSTVNLSIAKVIVGLLVAVTAISVPAHPQGCAQCRETIGQTSSRTQAAYRRAIILMTAAGSTIFLGSIFAFKRFR